MAQYVYSPERTQLQIRQTLPATVASMHIGFVLDRSQSMQPVKTQTIDGFNALLKEQQQIAKEAQLSLALFNDTVTLIHDNVPIADAPSLCPATYQPAGGTALSDAIGRTIQAIGKRASRLSSVLIVIITDGDENMSREFTISDIQRMIEYRQSKHHWQFLFLGPKSARSYALAIGIPPDHIFAFDADRSGITDLLRRLGSAVTAYRLDDPTFALRLCDQPSGENN
jgi:uncharacterized protein YegL